MNKILKAQRIVVVLNAMQKTPKGYKIVGHKRGTLMFLDDKPYMGEKTQQALRNLAGVVIKQLAKEFELAEENRK